MELSRTVALQVAVVFILIAVGFVLKKRKSLDEHGLKQFTEVLLMIVTPSVLIVSYQKEFKPQLALMLLLAAGCSIFLHAIMVIISTLIFRKEETNNYRISIFSSASSNCGFMAIPLLTAVLGTDGVFFGSAYLAVFNIFYWTYGICIFTGDAKSLSLKKAFLNPGVIGTVIGLLFFFTGTKLPKIVFDPLNYLAGLNTPVAMLILGSYLADVDFKKTLKKGSIYLVSLLRLIIFPVIAYFLTLVLGLDKTASTAILLTSACPVATVSTLFAARFGLDAGYASELVSFTTVISILTIPLIMLLA